ncbi:MAG: purine-nucleoside phosphorylase [Oscillospiraceae bacterium]|nr:purine-nucleoside phosphorylase [Oscillospiraceae bacterium]
MNPVYEKLIKCRDRVRTHTDFVPEIALILGSGLGDFADNIEIVKIVDYKDIEGFPVSTAPFHKGRLVFGYVDEVPVVCIQGRIHYYEGYPVTDVVLPARLMGLLGAKVLFLTNAAGGANPTYNAGDFMLIRDHILALFPNPLIGENVEELGTRFPDMSCVYDLRLREIIKESAAKLEIPLHEGVYCQFTGPSFETPAEVRMAGLLGGDAVGMSTACEAVAARHAGTRVVGISCITNKGAGLSETPLTHEEVKETGERVAPLFRKLVWDSIVNIHKELSEEK